jgi:tRNA/rRNA methyltransferase
MKNFGLQDLWLVNPMCDRHSDEAKHMAVHAPEILANAKVVESLPVAIADCQRVIATAGRIDQGEMPVIEPTTALAWLSQIQEKANVAIVFGAEDRGLSNTEIQHCQQVMRIPVNPEYPSLNLAQAVGICCYEWQKQKQFLTNPQLPSKLSRQLTSQIDQDLLKSTPIDLATRTELEAYYQQLETVLLNIGYLYPHTAFHRLQKFRQIGDRANLTSSEVRMLRGVLRQVNWAVKPLDK